jgi:hypothetical protein
MGALKVGVTLASYLDPKIRRIEDELPDTPTELPLHGVQLL